MLQNTVALYLCVHVTLVLSVYVMVCVLHCGSLGPFVDSCVLYGVRVAVTTEAPTTAAAVDSLCTTVRLVRQPTKVV